jgi:hypothetical protein
MARGTIVDEQQRISVMLVEPLLSRGTRDFRQ